MSATSTSEALLKEQEAADLLKMSARTLQGWRMVGRGPAYVRAGRSIRYRQADIVHWVDANTVCSVPGTPG